MVQQQTKAILLMGPTATGKTDLALKLAHQYPLEIISVDSALIYQGMDIGTAKPTLEQLAQVPHHLINIISPLATYSVAGFIRDTQLLIQQITKRGKLPLLVGGTMMYYNALINGLSELPAANACVRADLDEQIARNGLSYLYDKLVKIDQLAASKIMPQDKQRIIRALEIFNLTGKTISQLQQEKQRKLDKSIDYLPLAIVPNCRDVLHQRINMRFQKMLEAGFIDEVAHLQLVYPALTATHTSMRSVGYSEVWQYLANTITYIELLEKGMAATRQLAKRQITWLRSFNVINIDKAGLAIEALYHQLEVEIDKYLHNS